MLMKTDYIYTEAFISKSIVDDRWETDENGNPIVIIEASNENLDFEGEKVLRSALLNSKKYFLQNGVISYDHKHLPSADNFNWDPEWNAEKYVLGKPLDAWEGLSEETGEKVVKVKAVLSKSNALAKEIINKLKDNIGTVKASVGGRKVRKALKMDTKTYKETPTIVGVNWDEVALTYKPVNQTLGPTTLCPKDFVKSLTAGSETNPAAMTGGETLQVQSIKEKPIYALLTKMRNREITKSCDAINHLVKSGYSEEKAGSVLKVIIKKYLGDIMDGNEDVNDTIESATDELEKALNVLEDGGDVLAKGMSKMKDDGTYVKKGGHMYMKKSDGKYEKMDPDSPDYNGDDDDDDDEKVEKSLDDEVIIDATEAIESIEKSIKVLKSENKELLSMVKSLTETVQAQTGLMKSMGKVTMEDSALIKSMAGTPLPRQTTNGLNVQDRFQKSVLDKLKTMDAGTMVKSLSDKGVDENTIATANYHFRHGGVANVVRNLPQLAEVFVKES